MELFNDTISVLIVDRSCEEQNDRRESLVLTNFTISFSYDSINTVQVSDQQNCCRIFRIQITI